MNLFIFYAEVQPIFAFRRCLNDEISKGKAYNLDEIEGIQKFIESLPGEIKQNIVKL